MEKAKAKKAAANKAGGQKASKTESKKKGNASLGMTSQMLEISDVCLRDSFGKIHEDFQPLPFKDEPHNSHLQYMGGVKKVKIFEGENDHQQREVYYVYRAKMGLRIVRDGNNDDENIGHNDTLLQIEADYDVTYKLRGETMLSQDDTQSFGIRNAPFHAWPFFREYIVSTMQKMGLKPVILPMYHSDPGYIGINE